MREFFYSKMKKDGTYTRPKYIVAPDLDAAIEFIKKETKDNYKLFASMQEYEDYLDKINEEEDEKRRFHEEDLTENAKKIYHYLDDEGHCGEIEEKIEAEQLGLYEDTDKPYYILSYWEQGKNGCFADLNDIIQAMMEQVNNGWDDGCSLLFFDVAKEKQIKPIIKTIELK